MLSKPRYNLVAVSVGSYILFAGGQYVSLVVLCVIFTVRRRDASFTYSSVDIYDPAIDQWVNYSLPVPRTNIAASSTGGYAVFVGGHVNSTLDSAAVDIYDVTTNTWDHTLTLSTARAEAVAVGVGNSIFVAGGLYVDYFFFFPPPILGSL